MRPEIADQPVCAVVERRARLIARGPPSARRHPDGAVERIVSPFSITLVMMWQASAAYSSAAEPRRKRTCLASEARTGSDSVPSSGVSKMPGAIVITRTPSSASRGRRQCHPDDAALRGGVGCLAIWPSKAATDAVLITTPRSPSALGAFCAMCTAARRMQLKSDQVHADDTRELLELGGPPLPSVFMAVPMPAQLDEDVDGAEARAAASSAAATSSRW